MSVVSYLVLAASLAIAAQPPPFECRWATEPIEIDGKASESAWKTAQIIDRFYLPWLKENARPAKAATRARLLWDREYLYFFADLDDGDLFATITDHDGKLWENDVLELFFKPDENATGYYEFQVNAAGAKLDIFIPERGKKSFDEMKSDGPFHWKTAVVRRGTLDDRADADNGWSVEGRIPWTDLLRTGGRPVENELWRFALCRYDYDLGWDEPELSTCAPLVSKMSFHQHEEYARLKFMPMTADPVRPFGINKLPPLTASTVVGSPDPPLPYRTMRAYPNLKLNFPIAIDRVPGTETLLLIIQERSYGTAAIVKVNDSPASDKYQKLLDLPKDGVAYGICFHPKFAENGYLYVGWNGKLDDKPKQTIVTRYTWDHAKQTFDSATALHVIAWESDGHNGGDMEFGHDGMLYVTSGDGTSDSDTNMRGQDLTQLTAKILRIDVDRPDPELVKAGKHYRVPNDNPFVGQAGIVPETWAYGLRNPWRITVDPKTGHVWCTQNGQDLWEQVYFVRKGDNYGWSTYEGSHIFYAERKLGPHPHVLPATEHHHSEARSLTGGVVYHGSKLPDLAGAYIYGDYSTGRIWGVKHDGTKVTWHKLLTDTPFAISGFGIDSRGELLVADHRGSDEGALYYLQPTPADIAPSKFPRKLSESGLFADVAKHAMAPGIIPYSVNSPLWSDGAHKERFLALPHKPGTDMRIGYTRKNGWNFPDETVLVKSFALEMTPGDPTSRRWIETRFLTRQQGEWAGYSYLWNDDQTDAELVPTEGLDREYVLSVPQTRDEPSGKRKQVWHYPSRTECMVCHSRAANFVLGLSELQMNRDHDYVGTTDNQLRVFEHLGLFKLGYDGDAKAFLKEQLSKEGLSDEAADKQLKQLSHKSGQREAKETWLLAAPPSRYGAMPDPTDAKAPLETRVRSYLHANCAICHVEAGGGNAQMQLEFSTPLDKTGLVDVTPLHHKFGLTEPKIVAPGAPERSTLLHRLSHRGPNSGQMPQLATNQIDLAAVRLFEEWIKSLSP